MAVIICTDGTIMVTDDPIRDLDLCRRLEAASAANDTN